MSIFMLLEVIFCGTGRGGGRGRRPVTFGYLDPQPAFVISKAINNTKMIETINVDLISMKFLEWYQTKNTFSL